MGIDTLIAILLGVVTIVMAYMGMHVTIHPPGESVRVQRGYKLGFVLLALTAVLLLWWQGARSEQAQEQASNARRSAEKKIGELQGQVRATFDRLTVATTEARRVANLNTELQKRLLDQSYAIKDLTHEAINSATGGDSFCYVSLLSGTIDASGGIPIVIHMGRYPLRDVVADVVDVEAWTKRVADRTLRSALSTEATLKVGNIGVSSTRLMVENKIPFRESDSQVFVIRFSAQNGYWTQQLRARKIDNKWVFASRVLQEPTQRVLFVRVDPLFPRLHGRVDWNH
jgi:hypothetical protein